MKYLGTEIPEEQLVRVVRELEYIGPAKWVERTLSTNAIDTKQPGWLTPPKSIREISSSISLM